MPYRVVIRINAKTGEFEQFQVDATEVTEGTAAHNAAHERVAEGLGRLVERRPGIEEMDFGPSGSPSANFYPPSQDEGPARRIGGAERNS